MSENVHTVREYLPLKHLSSVNIDVNNYDFKGDKLMVHICELCDIPKRYEVKQHEVKGWYVASVCSVHTKLKHLNIIGLREKHTTLSFT